MTEAPTTTGRRVWALTWRLALPWVVCGGLLWAAVWWTTPVAQADGSVRIGQGVEVSAPPGDLLSAGLTVRRNPQGEFGSHFIGMPGEPVSATVRGGGPVLAWHIGESRWGRWFRVNVRLWLLLPFPLLWSGFNLWRWVRRAG